MIGHTQISISEIAFQDRGQILLRAVAENERALELANVAFNVGSTDLRPVQQQQLALYATRSVLVRVQSEQRLQRVNLHLALGGGWDRGDAPDQSRTAAEAAAATTATAENIPAPETAQQDRTKLTREGSTLILNVYHEKGIGGAGIRAKKSGWPQSMVLRFHGFPAMESLTAKTATSALLCETQRREGQPAELACTFNGAPVSSVRARRLASQCWPAATSGIK